MRPPMARQPAVPDASRPALLRLVLRDLVGETLGLLQDLSDRWPSQKACTQCLILDALCQPLDDPRCLPKGRARLRRIARCLIHPTQRRLDLPAFARQDRKSTRLNSSHGYISYAVFCLKKKTKNNCMH